ncbi:MAG TPA: hypothetical protein VL443_02890 [Cyclobacteriaceae bacterium]|jgi:hypothetical protein|nr:hypothetical protein [Cyclobacteriaceae bacterium]
MASIDNQYVSFSIIKRNNKRAVLSRIMLTLVSLFIIGIVLDMNMKQGHLFMILSFIVLGGMLITNIKFQLTKGYDETGTVTLMSESIQITDNTEIKEFLIQEVQLLKFKMNGYSGQPIIGKILNSKTGLNNYITIKTADLEMYFEILISNQYKIAIMERILNHYKVMGVEIDFKDLTFNDSQRSILLRFLNSLRYFFD